MIQLPLFKQCTMCGEIKPLTEFYRKGTENDRYFSWCKPCHLERARNHPNRKKWAIDAYYRHREKSIAYSKDWRKRNPERAKANNKAYEEQYRLSGKRAESRQRNKEKRLAYNAKWKHEHRDKVNASAYPRDARWREQHPEQAKAHRHKYKTTHRDTVNATTHRRRSKLKGNGGSYTATEWQNIKAKYDHRCLRCHRQEPEIKLTVDHVLPIDLGGPNIIKNIQPLCRRCNSIKHNQHIDFRPSA